MTAALVPTNPSCRYVLDTGIRFTHTEFRSLDGSTTVRARHGFSVFDDNNSTGRCRRRRRYNATWRCPAVVRCCWCCRVVSCHGTLLGCCRAATTCPC